MRLLICGDRIWTDKELIRTYINDMDVRPDVIIEGDAKGADRLAGEVAIEMGISLLKFPAEWKKYGRSAGPIRNQLMLNEGKPDFVVAFHDRMNDSRGTKDMLERAFAWKTGIGINIISHKDPGGDPVSLGMDL